MKKHLKGFTVFIHVELDWPFLMFVCLFVFAFTFPLILSCASQLLCDVYESTLVNKRSLTEIEFDSYGLDQSAARFLFMEGTI